jgi:hypothetical protein
MSLTIEHIRAAQDHDLDALKVLITNMDERITRLAAQAARRLNGDHREDFEQDAREALFLALPRVEGDDIDRAIGFLYSSMADALKDKVRAARYVGVDKDAVKVFMSVMDDADGDPHKAEQLAQTVPAKGLRLSADRAHAARLAFVGSVSMDKAFHGDDEDNFTFTNTLGVTDELPQVQPKVGTGAALEALAVLHRYSSAYAVLNALPKAPADVDSIEDAVTLPREASARKAVLDACAILRSYVSTAADGDLVGELRDVSDELRDERAAKIGMVHAALGKISPQQRTILIHSFGINDAEDFGWGDGCDVAGLAAYIGTTSGTVTKQRSAGRVSFAKHYIAMVARTLEDALSWEAAAVEARKPAGRK